MRLFGTTHTFARQLHRLALIAMLLAGCGPTDDNPVAGLPEQERGMLVTGTLLDTKEPAETEAIFGLINVAMPARYPVEIYRLRYRTVDPFGAPTIASGALAVPVGARGRLPLVSIQHWTVTHRASVASSYVQDPIAMGFSASGYVAALPDYLGLGVSEGMHPFMHAASLASATIDMLRAARTFCERKGIRLNDQLFLAGYSEGGFATMATQREIEARYAGEFTVTASAPMGGPYVLSETMSALLGSGVEYRDRYQLPYLLLTYNSIYNLFDSLRQIFRAPYHSTLPPLFDGQHLEAEINAAIPPVPASILTQSFLDDFFGNPQNPLRRAFRENNVYDWTPRAPVRLLHCINDEKVPFGNALTAYYSFAGRGAKVSLEAIDTTGHTAALLPCMLRAKHWFDSLRMSVR